MLEILEVSMMGKNLRKHRRIRLRLEGRLIFKDQRSFSFSTKDISLTGMYIPSLCSHLNGVRAKIILIGNFAGTELPISLEGNVTRKDVNGIAIKFSRMTSRNYSLLQTVLLYGCTNPVTFGQEFTQECPVVIKDFEKAIRPTLHTGQSWSN